MDVIMSYICLILVARACPVSPETHVTGLRLTGLGYRLIRATFRVLVVISARRGFGVFALSPVLRLRMSFALSGQAG